jgi:hypothetical protein
MVIRHLPRASLRASVQAGHAGWMMRLYAFLGRELANPLKNTAAEEITEFQERL